MHVDDITPEGRAITRSQFNSYEEVRKSGHYNMIASEAVTASGLPRDTYFAIIENYDWLEMKFFIESNDHG